LQVAKTTLWTLLKVNLIFISTPIGVVDCMTWRENNQRQIATSMSFNKLTIQAFKQKRKLQDKGIIIDEN